MMWRERLFPFLGSKPQLKDLTPQKLDNLSKIIKPKTLGLGFQSGYITFRNTANFEPPPYDFETILKAIDTDSYVKQAFLKYQDLFWKEGWTISGENFDAIDYLSQRIDLLEESMQCTFDSFLQKVSDQWLKFGNAFVVKSYGDLSDFYRNMSERSIIGYYTIPAQTVEIQRDKHNNPVIYRQRIFEGYSDSTIQPTWKANEVLHMHFDKKDGYAFGTPFVISALDDVDSLRRVEEDILNLVRQELNPLYTLTVGNNIAPAKQEELDSAASSLEDMRVNGGLVLSDRHQLDVIGAEGKALQVDSHLAHFKERVAVGLGLFPHHLGMSSAGTNRSATERLDTALYDRVKTLQEHYEGWMRINIFNELLREGGFDPIRTPYSKGPSDRCFMKFREIDIDTQIKRENHIVNKYNSNAIDWNELRMQLGMALDADPNLLYMTMMAQIQTAQQITVANHAPQSVTKADGTKGIAPAPKSKDGAAPSTGVVPNMPNAKKGSGNKVAPQNQFGRRLSPNVKRSDDAPLNIVESVVDLLEEFDEQILGENNE